MKREKQNGAHREDICPSKKLDLASVREKIDQATAHDAAEKTGPEYWRSLEELAGSEEFQQALHREFPKGASEWLDTVSRRGFLKVMGASLGLAGMTGCVRLPFEPIVPYVRQPEGVIPGRPMFYASAVTLGGYASPVLVESHLGRPTKIEGNDMHPASQGGTDIFTQASLLGLYDPDRSQSVVSMGDQRSWQAFLGAVRGPLAAQKALKGAGIRILTPTISSPTLADQLRNFLKIYPDAKWHVYEPVNRDNVLEGAKLAFGQPVETRYDFSKADVIVSLDADFLYAGFPGNTRYIRDFAKRRNPDSGNMNRLYVIESTPSSTGAKADHRIADESVRGRAYASLLLSLIAAFKVGDIGKDRLLGQGCGFWSLVKDLHDSSRIRSLVIAGDHQPPIVQAISPRAESAARGTSATTVFYTDPIDANPVNQTESIKDLVADMNAGKVDLLIILGGNPAYDAPADLNFADALKSGKTPLRVHYGLYQNETAELCQWHVNATHELESWGDARACDGTVSIIQPLIAPLYNGKSAIEFVIAALRPSRCHRIRPDSRLLAEAAYRRRLRAVLAQVVCTTAGSKAPTFAPKSVSAKSAAAPSETKPADPNAIELNIRRDPTIYDGQFSNNGWLQELPKPMNKLTWDNAVLMGPAMADRMGIKTIDVVELELNGKESPRPRLDSGWTSRQFRHHLSRLRPQARRPRRHRAGIRRLSSAHQRQSLDRHWRDRPQDR